MLSRSSVTALLTLAGRTASTAAAREALVASLRTGKSGREGPAVTTARSDVASAGAGAASKASRVTGEIPASTKRSVLAANPAMLRTPARARAGSASDWPARSARATSSAKEPRRELMVGTRASEPRAYRLKPSSQPLRRGEGGEDPGGEIQKL